MTVFRSHRAILGLSTSARAAPMVSYWPMIHRISRATSGCWTSGCLRDVKDAFTDMGGVGLTQKIQQQKYNIYTLRRPPQSRWNTSWAFSDRPQKLANIAWAYATLGEPHPVLFKKIADHIIKLDNLSQFTPHNLANIVLAYATLDDSHPELLKKNCSSYCEA